jgi:hypothetical protein
MGEKVRYGWAGVWYRYANAEIAQTGEKYNVDR